MTTTIDSQSFRVLNRIAVSPTGTITMQNLRDHFGKAGEALIKLGALVAVGQRRDVVSMTDYRDRSVEVVRHNGRDAYFSPTAGWVPVLPEEITLYGPDTGWLIGCIRQALGVSAHVQPKEIHQSKIWAFGEVWLQHAKHHVILAADLRKVAVFSALRDYLNSQHKRQPALVLTLDLHLPAHMQLPSHNRVAMVHEVMDISAKHFALNMALLAERMGGSVMQQGFSNGYRNAYINGVEHTFTKKQAEVLEVMDQAKKPMHQSEILAQTSSEQERLIQLFRKNGKAHPAWGAVIKNDSKGNFWLEY